MGKEASAGDVVTLHSGGPDLTVLRVHDGDADLGWFTATGEYRTGTLPLTVLRLRDKVDQAGATPAKPPRTGYRDLNTGIYHPAPDASGYEKHVYQCKTCWAEHNIAASAWQQGYAGAYTAPVRR